jgi:spore coat protein H
MRKVTLLLAFAAYTLFPTSFCFGQTTVGDSLFDDNTVHSIYITFPQGNYWSLLVSNKAYDDANDSSTYIPVSVVFDGQSLDSVGIQFKGNSSYYNYPGNKKPFTLSFNEYVSGQKMYGLKSLNLNNLYQDPSFMREKMFLDFCNAQGIPAPRANYVRLYINGDYWGLYIAVERIQKSFLKDRFGDNEGNLFKGDGPGASCADLRYHGTINSYYNCYTLKTNETANDWTDLINLTAQINNTSASQFMDSVEAVLNSNSFISAWAAYNIFVDFDSYPYRFIHNYYIYHDTVSDKFQWIVWDASTAFGMDVPMTVSQIENISVLYLSPPATARPLADKMLNDSIYKDTYLQYVCRFANNYFLPTVLNPKIDDLRNRIQSWVYADSLKMYTDQNFDQNINNTITIGNLDFPGLKSFIANRSASILAELGTLGYTNCPLAVGLADQGKAGKLGIMVSPNPSCGQVSLRISGKQLDVVDLQVFDIHGRMVLQSKLENEISNIELKQPAGVYFVRLQQGSELATQKIIIR